MVTDLMIGDVRARPRSPRRRNRVPSCGSGPSKLGYRPNAIRTSAKLMLDAVTATSIWPGPGGTRSNAASSIVSRSPGVRICRRTPSCSWSTTVVRRSSGRSGAGHKRAVYHSPLRQAVSSSSDPPSSCRATCSASVCSSTSIWVARRCGCSVPITRIRPRSPACSRLARSSAQHRLGVPGHDIQARRLAGNSASSRAMRTR